MAKEVKKTQSVEISAENVVEELKKGNALKKENVDAALAKIEEEKDEKQKYEAKRMIMCAQYKNTKELILLRARRREEKITKEALNRSKENLDKVLAGEITPTEYHKLKKESENKKHEEMMKSDNQTTQDLRELRNSYAGQYEWDWD